MNPLHTLGLSLTLSKQGIDPAKTVRPLSTTVHHSDPCRTRSLAGGLVLQVHLPVTDGPKAGALKDKKPFSVQLALLCSTPRPPSAEPALCRMALTSMPSLPDGPGGPRGPGGPCGPTL